MLLSKATCIPLLQGESPLSDLWSRTESSLLIESKPNQQTHAQPVLQPPNYTITDRSHRLTQNQQIKAMHQCFKLPKNEINGSV